MRIELMNELYSLNPEILEFAPNDLTALLLYGKNSFTNLMNSKILDLSMKYIKDTKRFDGPLF